MPTQGPLHSVGSAEFVEGLLRAGLATPAGAADLPKTTVLVEFDEQAEYSPLDKVRELEARGCTVVVACRERSLPDAVLAVQAGASGILLKPVTASSLRQLPGADTEDTAPAPTIDVDAWRAQYAPEIIGSSLALEQALGIAARAANCNCPVLITGENGTGKELLARALHRASSRAEAPFVAVNCPAIPRELVESELFGHTRGAFTGATVARDGRFAVADSGTLLLDEIGEMDLSIQSKLLRVLQDFQITRVGESRPQHVDVRILAATNRDLESMVENGTFREDLYYRLNVLQVELPPLRQRRDDILCLAEHFLASISAQRKLPPPVLSADVQAALVTYDWPGNVRQLHNVIERLVILRGGERIEVRDLPIRLNQGLPASSTRDEDAEFGFRLPPGGLDLRDALQRLEDSLIRQALVHTGGNRNQAAKILGLNRTTLVEKLRKRPSAAAAA